METEIVRRIARRDHDAVADLYDLYAPVLFGVSVRILRDARDAEDVLQEVFIQVFRDAPRYDPARASVRSWLFAITRSRALDRLRSRKATERRLAEPEAREAEPATGIGEEMLLMKRHVECQLAKLSERERKVLELAYWDGYTQEEISRVLSEPLGTIKSRTRAALAKLRALLSGAEAAHG